MLADCPFDAIFPDGADLGTVRLLPPRERAAWRCDSLSPLLVPLAEGGGRDLFAAYDPPEPGARSAVVCAVDRDSGVWAPLSSTVAGFAAWLLLLRRAQAGLPGHPAFASGALMEETEAAASRLAEAMGLKLGTEKLEADRVALAGRLRELDPASPWACSVLAREQRGLKEALSTLAPALLAAPFSAGLLEQVADLHLEHGRKKAAAGALLAALSRLEPDRQAAPHRLDEPDEETGALFEPFRPALAFRHLQEHPREVSQEARLGVAWAFLANHLEGNSSGELPALSAAEAIDASRRRGLGGDLPGGRWILHLALGEAGTPQDRVPLLEELAQQWALAGSRSIAARCRARAEQMRAAMEAGGRLG